MTLQGISSAASASNGMEVKVLNNQRHQQEAVVGKILEGVKEAKQAIDSHTGQHLNIVA